VIGVNNVAAQRLGYRAGHIAEDLAAARQTFSRGGSGWIENRAGGP
jgi:hypothetical protein